jgi:hypothetical protein
VTTRVGAQVTIPDVLIVQREQASMCAALAVAERHRAERNAAIVRLADMGWTPGKIHRMVAAADDPSGLSQSNITAILRLARAHP